MRARLFTNQKATGISIPLLDPRFAVTRKGIFLDRTKPSDFATIRYHTSKRTSDRVIVMCINGRAGGVRTSGMNKLRDTLRKKLSAAFGVAPSKIFRASWNKNQDSNPLGTPSVDSLLAEINSRTKKPSYLAIIGHSYGGWAASKLSRATRKYPNFVGLIDPVYGPSNKMTSADVPRGLKITNWYQKYGIIGGEPCTGLGRIPCFPRKNGLSCGYQNVPRAQNSNEALLKTWEGKVRKKKCAGNGTVSLRTSHINIDDDEWIHRQIYKRISSDLGKIIKRSSKT